MELFCRELELSSLFRSLTHYTYPQKGEPIKIHHLIKIGISDPGESTNMAPLFCIFSLSNSDKPELFSNIDLSRSAPLRSASLRSAPLRSASLRLAPLRSASLRLASLRLALLRLASCRLVPLRLVPLRLAPLRLASLRLASLQVSPAQVSPN